MRVYFACSITGGRNDEGIYQAIVAALLDEGHEVPTAHLASPEILSLERIVAPQEIYTRDIDWINTSDAMVAEVSTPSHGVGFEIGYALSRGIPVLCCHQDGVKVSKMITGNTMYGLEVKAYSSSDEAEQVVHDFLRLIANKDN